MTTYVGSSDLAVSETARRELGQTRYDDLRFRWLALVEGVPVIKETPSIIDLAEALIQEHELHDDPPQAADALIAAAAIETGRVVVTENWRDFHFIDDLRFLDIRGVTRSDLPIVRSRDVEHGGPVPGKGCCRRLVAARS